MSVAGGCEICQTEDVDFACDRCGGLVCADHFDETVGLCLECVAEVDGRPTEGDREELPDGVDTYRF